MKLKSFFLFLVCFSSASFAHEVGHTLYTDKTLYVTGYAHLDTQWRWDYVKTINDYIVNTMEDNFALLEKYPEYNFNFTGSSRYQMMKEYYPEKFKRVKKYVDEGRWFVVGSSVDECDVLVPSPESIMRQILYGNKYFREEFGKDSVDFMLPDCFGFPAYLPSLWSHAGLKGFSTQKLSWNSTVGIPFNVGMWEGPDGNAVIGALNATAYTGSLPQRQDTNQEWVDRMEKTAEGTGVYMDYRYYGTGDMGGAPREEDVKRAVASLNNPDSKLKVKLSSTDQMYKDMTEEEKSRLRRYNGELMLTEHSAGVATSKTFMKRMNRKNELLADAAERAAAMATWMDAIEYPSYLFEESWKRVLVSQMHDILPGTSLQRCYEYSWNDELLASNGFASIVTNSVSAISRGLDTKVKGQAVVLYNPLTFDREDVVKASVTFPKDCPEYVRVYNEKKKEVPSQIIAKKGNTIELLFLADLDSLATTVYDVRESSKACSKNTGLKLGDLTLENDYYIVTLTKGGDIASVYDKNADTELLSEPTRLEFHRSFPSMYPAWNMDWKDRSLPAIGKVDGPAEIKVVENGPARIAIEVTRHARNSFFTQRICLAAGEAGKKVEIENDIDWQSKEVILKAAFPLAVHNQSATYTQGMGTVANGNNNPKKFEYLSHQWFDLTDESGDYGVSILEDCKFGSDKPTDNLLRLTLVYTPGYNKMGYNDQRTQDWGLHEFVYAIYGHERSWQHGKTEQQARRLNQPIMAFQVPQHKGKLGKSYSLASLNTDQVDFRAIKKAEESDLIIIRLQELIGKNADNVVVELGDGIASGYEVDGQERRIGPANIYDGKLHLDMTRYSMHSFALKLKDSKAGLSKPVSTPVGLPYNAIAFTSDKQGVAGDMGAEKRSMPVEEVPAEIESESIKFTLRKDASVANAVACMGQKVKLPSGDYNKIYFLASADDDVDSTITLGNKTVPFSVQYWTGFVGQWDKRIWDREHAEVDFQCLGFVVDIIKGYVKRDDVAWYCTHRHDKEGANETYQFSYMFKYELDLTGKEKEITLPDNPAIKIYAISVANDQNIGTRASLLYDNFDDRKDIELRMRDGAYEYGRHALGKVEMQKAENYEALTLCTPSEADYADQATGNGAEFTYFEGDYAVHPGNGEDHGILTIINNGKVSVKADDKENSTYFDYGVGHFLVDLKKPVKIINVNTFSCHPSNRASQKFSLWASKEKLDPDDGLYDDHDADHEHEHEHEHEHGEWDYIATVDTKNLDEGGVHASSVSFPEGEEYQYLMWITEQAVQGTFFNEIDVITK